MSLNKNEIKIVGEIKSLLLEIKLENKVYGDSSFLFKENFNLIWSKLSELNKYKEI